MKVKILYTGLLRTWDQCKQNHWENLQGDPFFYTNECPESNCVPISTPFYPGDDHPYNNRAPETHVNNARNMWHNLFVGFSLLDDRSDVYVRNRADILFDSPINFEDYNTKGRVVYIPEGNDYREGINDQFAFGSYKTMRNYVSLYLHYDEYYRQGIVFHPETMLRHHLFTTGYAVHRIPVKQQIVR